MPRLFLLTASRLALVAVVAGLACGRPAAAQSAAPPGADDTAAGADAAAIDPTAPARPLTTAGGYPALRPALDGGLNSVVRPMQSALAPARPALPLRSGPAEDPEQPQGLRAGNFLLLPSIHAGGGATTNAAGTARGEGSGFLTTDGELLLRHEGDITRTDLSLKGSYTGYLDGDTESDPTFSAAATSRVDLTETDRVDLGLGYSFAREEASSAETGGSSERPAVEVFSADVGYTRSAGLIGLALKGSTDRTAYGRAEGTNSSDRTNTAFAGTLRLSYDTGAIVSPFVEGGGFGRVMDRARDAEGYRRSSLGWELKGGLAVTGETLTGEIAVGYAREEFDDARLAAMDGLVVDGSLAYAASELTTIGLDVATSFSPTRLAGASGFVTTSADASLTHELFETVELSLGGGVGRDDYAGLSRSVTTYTVRAGLDWRLRRDLTFTLDASHAYTDSSVAGDDSRESRIEAGLTYRP